MKSATFYAGLSVATSVVTIALKFAAYYVTGSVGLLSDAIEGFVNLAAALAALGALTYAAREPDPEHNFGHEKAEYFSSGLEGALIFLAAGVIAWTAVPRLLHPVALEQVGMGIAFSIAATLANAACAAAMLRAARAHRSIALEADARHLLTDVWTTVGVVVGVLAVKVTGWLILDPLIAIVVAVHILWTGVHLVRRSFDGLMDRALPEADIARIRTELEALKARGCDYHALRTRQAGSRGFVDVHVLVPGAMSVQEGHDLVEHFEQEVRKAVAHVEVLVHLEPLEDPRSWDDNG
ncbi:cation diffusion facilitator family transporter [Usitatibacter palustris]|uniref:Ferrous-iron efflux pump FieF n=1 Tax=Usitatibacter palustris TaxID=2732487 RepID=A0A6M4H689_9PROT|nr:cation diffusion facilitator family transporter [Usitatibacter palustris]QJR14173.1 Ferrous-iron efflux pump FieF [Usitatibacter palustris]